MILNDEFEEILEEGEIFLFRKKTSWKDREKTQMINNNTTLIDSDL